MKKINGFTLAEVLITLVIIGIIAAMTIPSLMNKTNEQETVVAVKKAYSILGQAYQRMVAENGEFNSSYFGSTKLEITKNFGDEFVKYFNVQKNCKMETNTDCWSTENGGMYKFFDGSDWVNWNGLDDYYKFRLSDGMSVGYGLFKDAKVTGTAEYLKNVTGDFFVDVNGDKGPNTLGKDTFTFWLTKYGFVPVGTPSDDAFDSSLSLCKTYGRGCAAWVITKGNMDYLRKDISW